MLFVEFRFAWFYALAAGIYWSLANNLWRKRWLLACSYVFYGAWDPRFCLLIAFSTTVDFVVGGRLQAAEANEAVRRRWLLLSLAVNLGVLGFFKYFHFFVDSAVGLLGLLGLPAAHRSTLQIILPVGVSFFTFQSLSYTLDVYRRRLTAVRDFADLALAVSFFPQLVAGPIMRAADFLPQLAAPRRLADVDWRGCVTLFGLGFFKKACVADNLAPTVDAFFANPAAGFSPAGALLGVAGYAVQIYCDFSGYTDMAIAGAGGLGYRLCRNFDHPYFATDIADFWRRWHVSLSSWLRDYLYVPLGGNRGGEGFVARNLLLTMLLGGLWHGAAWHFVLWGGLHGAALVAHRAWNRAGGRLPAAVGVGLTFAWVCGCWVVFRAPDLPTAVAACRALVPSTGSPGGVGFTTTPLPGANVWAVGLPALALAHALAWRRTLATWWARLPDPAFAAACGLVFGVMLTLLPTRYAPFIYFQF